MPGGRGVGIREAAGELRSGGYPSFMLRLMVLEKLLEQFDQIVRVGNIFIQFLAHALLIEDGLQGTLEGVERPASDIRPSIFA
jgi:hypothetical protein